MLAVLSLLQSVGAAVLPALFTAELPRKTCWVAPVFREQSQVLSVCRENVVLTGWKGMLTSVGAQCVDVNLRQGQCYLARE